MTSDRLQNWLYTYPFLQKAVDWKNILMNIGRFRSIPLRLEPLSFQPFFIVGSGRSGNTLLRRLLTTCDGVVIPPETYVLGKLIRLHYAHKSMPWDDYVNLMLSTIEYFPEFSTFGIDSLAPLAAELKDLPESKRSLATLVDDFYQFYSREKGMNLIRWGDKTPLNAVHVYRIRNLFPNAKFIHIVRDGVDVVHSYVNAGFYKKHAKAAERWVNAVAILDRFSTHYPTQCLTISYEGLVENPQQEMLGVANFLGIEHMVTQNLLVDTDKETGKRYGALSMGDVEMRHHHENVLKPITKEYVGKGRRELSPQVLSELAPILNKTLARQGYETIG